MVLKPIEMRLKILLIQEELHLVCLVKRGLVQAEDNVGKGQFLGRVGHSGNSTEPHLHFHLMDNSDLAKAKGISCAFEKYEVLQDGEWKTVRKSIPSDKDRIRFNE